MDSFDWLLLTTNATTLAVFHHSRRSIDPGSIRWLRLDPSVILDTIEAVVRNASEIHIRFILRRLRRLSELSDRFTADPWIQSGRRRRSRSRCFDIYYCVSLFTLYSMFTVDQINSFCSSTILSLVLDNLVACRSARFLGATTRSSASDSNLNRTATDRHIG